MGNQEEPERSAQWICSITRGTSSGSPSNQSDESNRQENQDYAA
jgi:hypothetical protein